MPAAPSQPSRWRRALTWVFRAALAWVGATVGVVALLRVVDPPTTAFMLERRFDGERGDKKPQQQWVRLSNISNELKRALIAAEDQKFATHHGFDFDQIAAAFEDRIDNKRSRGASTLTQQVAKNLFLWPTRSLFRKGLEAYFTVLIEGLWPKRRILEMHLNIAEYGDGVYGAEAASRTFFHKPASALTSYEAARLVTVLPSPRKRHVLSLSPAMELRARHIADEAHRSVNLGDLEGL
jgi:monofunctional biosynthetic peptidoglycan transglycosylase